MVVLVGSGRLILLFRDLPRDLFLLTLELGGFSRCSTGSLSRVSLKSVSWCLWLRGLPNYIERICSSGLQPWEKFCPVTHLRPAAVCAHRHTGMLRGCGHPCLHSPALLTPSGFPWDSAAVVETFGKHWSPLIRCSLSDSGCLPAS